MRLKNMRIRRYVEIQLQGQWVEGRYYPGLSPEQISLRIERDLPGEKISHEAIYQWIFSEARHLIGYLERLGKYRRRRSRTENVGRKRKLKEAKRHISERPEGANDRSELGHIERDAIVSARGGRAAILNSVDRKTRYMRALRIADLTAESGKEATIEMLRDEPRVACRSVTNDNGTENGGEASIEAVLGIDIFTCTPYAPQERGSVERANRTLRRVFPKGTDFDEVSDEEVLLAVEWYNNRPLAILKGDTPSEAHQAELERLAELKAA